MATYNVEDMLTSLQSSLGPLYQLATGSAYLIGISFALKGIYDLKVYGDMRTMMSSNASIKGPLITLFVAAMCIYLPTGFEIMMNTTFGYSSVMAYEQFPTSGGGTLSVSAQVLLQIVQVIGAYAFVRGWVLLARSATQGGHGIFGKGLIHVVGGVFAMNIVGTFNVIAATFGITF